MSEFVIAKSGERETMTLRWHHGERDSASILLNNHAPGGCYHLTSLTLEQLNRFAMAIDIARQAMTGAK